MWWSLLLPLLCSTATTTLSGLGDSRLDLCGPLRFAGAAGRTEPRS